jgi:chromate transporter
VTGVTDQADGAFANGRPTLAALFVRFLRYGMHAFGGPVVQIASLRAELVGKERWTTHATFTRALAVYQALPGPEATEMCCWFGHIARGRLGALAAGLGFLLPGFTLMLLCAWLYGAYGLKSPWCAAACAGLQPAALALLVRAVPKVAAHSLKVEGAAVACAFAFIAEWNDVPFWIPLLAGAAWCGLAQRGLPLRAFASCAVATAAWWTAGSASAPAVSAVGGALAGVEGEGVAADAWLLFVTGLKAGSLTFGGAYTAIPFVRDDVVTRHAWITDDTFLDGLAIGSVIPAPLVIFTTFVGYLSAGFPGAFAITIGMFLPAFSFTLFGHAWIDRIVNEPRMHAALDGVAAAALGLIIVTALRLCMAQLDGVFSISVFAVALLLLVRFSSVAKAPLVLAAAAVAGMAAA